MKPNEAAKVIDLESRLNRPVPSQANPRIVAVGGGKGGIGKTLIAASVGIALARHGRKVLLVDADLGGASLHTALGLPASKQTLSDFVHQRVDHLEEVVIPSGYENLAFLPGSQDVLDPGNFKYQQKVKLLRGLQSMEVDYVVLDLGAGTGFSVLDFFLIADHGVLVILPEPTSVANAYRFVKSAFLRRLQCLEEEYGVEEVAQHAVSTPERALRTPFEMVADIRGRHPELGERMERELRQLRLRLVVNQARTSADQEVGPGVVSAWRKLLGVEMDHLGSIRYDDEAWKSVRARRPVLVERPDSEAAVALQKIADKLLALDDEGGAPAVVTP